MSVLAALVAHRYRSGMTQQQVADNMGVSSSFVGRIETSRTITPLLTTIEKYAAAIGVRLTITADRGDV